MQKHTIYNFKQHTLYASLVFALCFILGLTGKALADEGEKPQQTYQLPTITVTADKRTSDVQKTATAITVITADKIEDANMDTIQDVVMSVPNLNVANSMGMAYMSFRGIPTSVATGSNPLIMYIDGVPTDTYFSMDAPLMDIERVEVLRGAQSAIYGKNAMGGVINVISRKPDNEWRAALNSEYGSYNAHTFSGMVSGPIVEDILSFSVSGMYKASDGYMDYVNTKKSNAEQSARFKGQLRFTPTDSTEFNFHANYTQKRNDAFNTISGIDPTFDASGNPDDYLHDDIWNLALLAIIDFDYLTAESVTTYRNNNRYYTNDMAWMSNADVQNGGIGMVPIGPFMTDTIDTGRNSNTVEFTQEFRLKSPDDKSGFTWLFGLFGGYIDANMKDLWTDVTTTAIPGVMPSMFMALRQPNRQYTYDYAIFGEVMYPFADAFKVTLALRGQHTRKKIQTESNMIMLGMTTNLATYEEEETWSEVLPKLVVSYNLTDDAMIYVGVNRSFLPGGFNSVSMFPNAEIAYDAQTAWNYEIGTKTEWFDNRLIVNVVAFYSDIQYLQIFQLNPASNTYEAYNAGIVKSYGVEIDAIARIYPGLDAEFSFGYTHAEFEDYKRGNQDFSGNRTPFSPDYTASFALQYRHETGLFVRGEALHFGPMYWDEANDYKRDSITLLNARIGYEYEEFGVYVYGNNLGNVEYLDYYTAPPFNMGNMAPPREIGVQLKYSF